MTRPRMITFGAINIALPRPHDRDRYIEMFSVAYEQAKKASLQGDWVGLLGQIEVSDNSDAGKIVRGEFYKYVDLDVTRNWYNVVSRKPAKKDELAKLVIPDDLKPHFQFLPFVFFANWHRLICVTRDGQDSMSVAQVSKILRAILGTEKIKTRFGFADITVEPSLESLEQILKMPRLRRLELDVTRPNPDDFGEFERDFLDEMEEQNASSMRVEIVADRVETLTPNERTKMLAKLAQSNGKVVGIGGPRGNTRTLSTAKHPFEEKASYRPDLELRAAIVFDRAHEILKKIVNRK